MIGQANAEHVAEPAQHQAQLWGGGEQGGELGVGEEVAELAARACGLGQQADEPAEATRQTRALRFGSSCWRLSPASAAFMLVSRRGWPHARP